MSQVSEKFTVCDGCGGAIPDGADRIQKVFGTAVIGGAETSFGELDFCCSQHMIDYVGAAPQIATPVPLYPPPPQE